MKIDIGPLPDGYVVLDCIVLLKVLNQDGSVVFREHFGTTLNLMEKYGMVQSAVDTVHDRIQGASKPDD